MVETVQELQKEEKSQELQQEVTFAQTHFSPLNGRGYYLL
jgi:hypothetical protein